MRLPRWSTQMQRKERPLQREEVLRVEETASDLVLNRGVSSSEP